MQALGFLCLLAATPVLGASWFVDVAAEVGIDFLHQDGRSGQKYYVETGGSGGGWLDFDDDGDLDLYLVNAAPGPGSDLQATPRNALYENRGGRFVEVTESAGVGDTGFGTGFCVGDVDADGRLDFLVTNYGADRLFRNRGDGTFEDVAERVGVAGTQWSTSCAFGDLDSDGDLDVYVTHYVRFDYEANPFCGDRARNLRAYCRPEVFDGVTDSLFINRGDGTFRDEASTRGIAAGVDEKGFGVVLSDLDDDADLDIYVANDGTLNRLYTNSGRGRFEDRALLTGSGANRRGLAESGMGVDVGDADGDGSLDILVTNYSMESNTLYRNRGELGFEDVSARVGLGEPSFRNVGWGVVFFDYDNDGDLDFAVANGHAIDNIEQFESLLSYKQQNQLFENTGAGQFREVTSDAGESWQVERSSRGLALADWNDDGRLDLLVTNTNEPAQLFENRITNGNHWLGVELRGSPANPFAIGARVEARFGDQVLRREVRSGSSFLSQPDLRVHFGLGNHGGPVEVEIRWPDGAVQTESTDRVDRYWEIEYRP